MKYLLTIPILITSISTNAEIITDGTLGQQINLPGSNFQITSDLGQQHGGNLFHSFQDFNLNSSETATFSGSNSIHNIISRVTGGNPSNIDGLIRSTIPNADMYFLNPYGIMFGPNAKLDVQGSFHASTADYLRLGENGRFDVRNPSDSLLTVAPIEAFGFLTNSPTTITTQDSNLSVPDYQTLSLIGGDLELNGELVFDESGEQQFRTYADPIMAFKFKTPVYTNQIITKSGRINLVSTASKGEVLLTDSEVKLIGNGGEINAYNTDINVNGDNGGSIFIRAGKLQLINSHLESQTLGNQDGNLIDVQVDNLIMQGDKNYSSINTDTMGAGQSSTINLRAKQIQASNGTTISGNAIGTGSSAKINIKVEDDFTFLGQIIPELGKASSIESIIMNTSSNSERNNSGSISVESGQLTLTDSASIVTITFGSKSSAHINVKVHDSLKISGVKSFGPDFFFASGIMAMSFTGSPILQAYGISSEGGNSGNIKVEAGQIEVKEAGMIATVSYVGDAGNIEINVNKLNLLEGGYVSATTVESGNGGTIIINADDILVSDLPQPNTFQGFGSSISTESFSSQDDAGIAGAITIQANKIKLDGTGFISTTSENAAGGNIELIIPNLLYLQDGKITTSVSGGNENGGNITLKNPTFIIMNNGKIAAQADAGHGGDINIKSKQFITSPNSLVTASSKLGLDGNVKIESPDISMEGFLVILSEDVVEASNLMEKPCSMQGSSFTVQKINGSSQTPYDYQAARYLPEDKMVTTFKKLDKKLAFSTCKNF